MAIQFSPPYRSTDEPLQQARHLLKQACDQLGYAPSVYEILKEPMRTFSVSIPVKMDSGQVRTFMGYRVHHTDVTGPCKGGIRFHPDVSLHETQALAIWMTLKCALIGLPYGGGKGGVVCDVKTLSPGELERLSRGYIRAIAPHIGPDKDIPAPDVYTNARIMGWMVDEFNTLHGCNCPGVLTGKPIVLGGSPGRAEATARGITVVIREAADRAGIDLERATVSIQGFGNAGYISAELLHQLGATIIAVSDSSGAIYNADGLDPAAVAEHKREFGTVRGYRDAKAITPDEVLSASCDILVPAALEGVITRQNARAIRARIVAEAANGPTTPGADTIMHERGIMVIPDILANAGGVTASYFEWVQNLQQLYWTEAEVIERLDRMLVDAFHRTYEMSQQHKSGMRSAAYMVALERIAGAMQARGWV